MEHDFRDYHRTDERIQVSRAQRIQRLRHEMLLADAGDIASERHPLVSRAKAKTVIVAGEVAAGVPGKQVGLVAFGTEGKRRGRRRAKRIEITFIEDPVAVGSN